MMERRLAAVMALDKVVFPRFTQTGEDDDLVGQKSYRKNLIDAEAWLAGVLG